jgi:hypothetical protein
MYVNSCAIDGLFSIAHFQPAVPECAEQVDEDGVAPIPGIQQRLAQAPLCCVGHDTPFAVSWVA